ncbi:hypothetical protein Goshw_019012 [Gossypium schwendimanii]|uniref:Uncharacterized protein n=1 Tax=Gossypium schwendimanii TaxID=34291 RepID=A0A7J9LHU3_GOSSC|nr:hypothetical protein [Gossypium schwendimanii]
MQERDEHVYTSFLDLVNKHWGEQDVVKFYTNVMCVCFGFDIVAYLFWDHPDLLEEFKIFLPNTIAS